MADQKRALTVTVAAIINGVIGANTGALFTITEGVFNQQTEELSEMISSGPIIDLDQLSYSHNYNEDDPDVGNLLIKNGDVDVLVINGQDYDPSDESDWIYDKRVALWNAIYTINTN